MAVEITIDKEKCNYSMYDPLGCKKCLQICSAKVFATRPAQKRDFSIPREQRVDPIPAKYLFKGLKDDSAHPIGVAIGLPRIL